VELLGCGVSDDDLCSSVGGEFTGVPCASFEAVFRAVGEGGADRALIPIENSLGGSIHENYDLLLRHRFNVIRELDFRV